MPKKNQEKTSHQNMAFWGKGQKKIRKKQATKWLVFGLMVACFWENIPKHLLFNSLKYCDTQTL